MTYLSPRLLCLALSVGLLAPSLVVAQPPSNLEARRKALNDLLAEQWEYKMRTSPIYASTLGDKRWNDKLNDFSQAFIDKDLEQTRNFVTRFEAIDTAGFPEQEALNKTLMLRDLKTQLEDAHFKTWEMPVTQFDGIHIDMPQLVSVLSFETVKDYDDYIARLKALPVLFEQTEIQMRKGMADCLMPPRILLDEVVGQANGIAIETPERSPFAEPFLRFPKAVAAADRQRLQAQGLAAIRDSVLPAYVQFTRFVRDDYAPKGRTERDRGRG